MPEVEQRREQLPGAVAEAPAKPAEPPPVKAAEPPPIKPAAPAAAKAAAPAPQPTAPAKAAPHAAAKPAAPSAAAPAAPKPAPKPASRVEPAQAATQAKPTPAPAAPTTTPLPHAAAAKAAAAGAGGSRQPAAEDLLRQTQTVRAIAEAKSLDDLSDIDAATLFGDAELDLVSAALASASDWPDDDAPTATPTPAPSNTTGGNTGDTTGTKAHAPSEEAFDHFGLDDNAPLEHIDDATLPPANPTRKTAAR